jgi:hypothetical protein
MCLATVGKAFVLTSPFIERDSRKLENRQFPHAEKATYQDVDAADYPRGASWRHTWYKRLKRFEH